MTLTFPMNAYRVLACFDAVPVRSADAPPSKVHERIKAI